MKAERQAIETIRAALTYLLDTPRYEEALAALDLLTDALARAEQAEKALGACAWTLENRHNPDTATSWEADAVIALEGAWAALAPGRETG